MPPLIYTVDPWRSIQTRQLKHFQQQVVLEKDPFLLVVVLQQCIALIYIVRSNNKLLPFMICKMQYCYLTVNWIQRMADAFKDFHPVINSAASELEQLETFAAKVSPEVLSNMCAVERCLHGGSCVSDASKPLGYTCQCRTGFHGYMCQVGKSIASFKSIAGVCCCRLGGATASSGKRRAPVNAIASCASGTRVHSPVLPCHCSLGRWTFQRWYAARSTCRPHAS